MKKFWIVMNRAERGHRYGQAYFRHESRESAEAEAKRLASQYRDSFLVLETVAGFAPPLAVESIDLK